MKIYKISVDKILMNDEFRFTSPGFSPELKESISSLGVINPIYLISKEENYKILTGFKRINCTVTLKHKTIPARIINQEEIKKLFRGLILEHLSYHTLNVIEQSKIVRILNRLGISWEQQKKDYLKIIGVPPQKNVVEKILKLLEFPIEVQKYIEEYDMSLKQTEIFRRFNSDLVKQFVKIAKELSIRSVELEKIITFFEDIAGKESVTINKVFTNLEIDTIFSNENLSRNHKIQEITKKLQQRRYSKLRGWNNKLEHLRKRLESPDSVHISWDNSLEKPGLIINTNIESINDVEEFITYLSTEKIKESIKKMLDIV